MTKLKPFSIHMVLEFLVLRSRLQPGQCKVLGPGVWVVGTVASVPAAVSSSNSTVYTLHIQTLLHTTH